VGALEEGHRETNHLRADRKDERDEIRRQRLEGVPFLPVENLECKIRRKQPFSFTTIKEDQQDDVLLWSLSSKENEQIDVHPILAQKRKKHNAHHHRFLDPIT
jgi:hypothetical protein